MMIDWLGSPLIFKNEFWRVFNISVEASSKEFSDSDRAKLRAELLAEWLKMSVPLGNA